MNWTSTQKFLIGAAVVICLLSIAVAAWAFAAWGFSLARIVPPTGGIKVAASAEVNAVPDVAAVTFGVVTRDKIAQKAATRNAEKSTYIVAALAKMGVPKKDIKTVEFSLQGEYDYNVRPERFKGYKASNQIRVRTKDLAKIGKLIDAAINAGANNVEGISFDVEQKGKLREKALALAVERAKGKARAIANAMGASLGKPISATESVDYGYGYGYSADSRGKADLMRYSTPIMPGETSVTCNVTVTFSIK